MVFGNMERRDRIIRLPSPLSFRRARSGREIFPLGLRFLAIARNDKGRTLEMTREGRSKGQGKGIGARKDKGGLFNRRHQLRHERIQVKHVEWAWGRIFAENCIP